MFLATLVTAIEFLGRIIASLVSHQSGACFLMTGSLGPTSHFKLNFLSWPLLPSLFQPHACSFDLLCLSFKFTSLSYHPLIILHLFFCMPITLLSSDDPCHSPCQVQDKLSLNESESPLPVLANCNIANYYPPSCLVSSLLPTI
jgi:hypothetical protein